MRIKPYFVYFSIRKKVNNLDESFHWKMLLKNSISYENKTMLIIIGNNKTMLIIVVIMSLICIVTYLL